MYGLKREMNTIVWLTESEVHRQYQAAENIRNKAILKLFYNTGARIYEMVQMDIKQNGKNNYIDFENRIVYFNKVTKRKDSQKEVKSRSIKVSEETIKIVKAYLKKRLKPKKEHESALFISRFGNRLSYIRIWALFVKTAIKAGIKKKVTPYTAKHSFCIQIYRKTRNPLIVMKLSGSRTLQSIQPYVDIVEKEGENMKEKEVRNMDEEKEFENIEAYDTVSFDRIIKDIKRGAKTMKQNTDQLITLVNVSIRRIESMKEMNKDYGKELERYKNENKNLKEELGQIGLSFIQSSVIQNAIEMKVREKMDEYAEQLKPRIKLVEASDYDLAKMKKEDRELKDSRR